MPMYGATTLAPLADGCTLCGFRADEYSAHDLATSPRWLNGMTDQLVDPVASAVLADPAVSTPLRSLREVVGRVDPAGVDPVLVHDAIHRLRELGRILHTAGAGVATQTGSVAQLNAGGGGVPKQPVLMADVGRRGLLGDRQGNRKHHGRPFQALCLWSAEVVDALAAEGHPIHAGAAGENVTIVGLDWTTLRPGARVRIGTVLCELSAWATPCRKIDRFFVGRSERIGHDRHPGWARVYAWVLEPGVVITGDEVVVEP
jgi:MOSC domain-containing protein YiiM